MKGITWLEKIMDFKIIVKMLLIASDDLFNQNNEY